MNTQSSSIDVKKRNTVKIIDFIRKQDNVVFSDISEKTGISMPTISRAVRFLLQKKLVIDTGIEKSPIGRHARIMEFNFNYGYVIGVHIGESKIRAAITSLDGTTIGYKSIYTKEAGEAYEVLDAIVSMIADMVKEASVDYDDVTAISIGIPGVTDIEKGLVVEAPNIEGWKNMKVVEALSKRLNKKILIDNDANMAVLGESWQLLDSGIKNTIFINFGTGIGSGIIIDGKLHRGRNNAAGEIGFMSAMFGIHEGQYVNKGYLESKAGMHNLYEDVLQAVKKDGRTMLHSVMPAEALQNYADFDVDYVDMAAGMNDDTAIQVLEPYINYWGSAIVNSISVLAPDIVFVGGDINIKNMYIYNKIMHYVSTYMPDMPNIYFVKEGHRSEVYGAVKLGIEYTFDKIKSSLF